MLNKFFFALAALSLSPFFMADFTPANGAEQETVLVLGTKSSAMSDLDDRLTREETMRQLISSGISVVPVMVIEREIREESLPVRSLSDRGIFELGEKLQAQWAVNGSLSIQNHSAIYSLKVYSITDKKLYNQSFSLAQDIFPALCVPLAEQIALRTKECIKQTKK